MLTKRQNKIYGIFAIQFYARKASEKAVLWEDNTYWVHTKWTNWRRIANKNHSEDIDPEHQLQNHLMKNFRMKNLNVILYVEEEKKML